MDGRTVAFVLAGHHGDSLRPLTATRPKELAPLGGLFRVADFTVSNLLNSQLRHIYFVCESQRDRFESYIRDGWTRVAGEFRWDRGEDLACLAGRGTKRRPGSADLVFQNFDIAERNRAKTVLILTCDQLYQMDYGLLVRQHINSDNDLTVSVSATPARRNIGVYAFRREALLKLMTDKVSGESPVDIERDIVEPARSCLRTGIFELSGYRAALHDLDDYHAANMALISGESGLQPYTSAAWPIRPLSGTKMLLSSRYAVESRVALGARLTLCKVTRSAVSAGVRVEPGAEVADSLLLSGSRIGSGAQLRNTIVLENVEIPPGTRIGFDTAADCQRYFTTSGGIVVVTPEDEGSRPYVKRRCARVATKSHSVTINR